MLVVSRHGNTSMQDVDQYSEVIGDLSQPQKILWDGDLVTLEGKTNSIVVVSSA
jgi:hypothetical protein